MLKNQRWIYNLIALFILLAGMCLEEVKADSIFWCPNVHFDTAGERTDAVWMEQTIEPTEVICMRNAVTGNQISEFLINSRKTIKLSIAFLCVAIVSLLLSNFYRTECVTEVPHFRTHTTVLMYIHDTDGKK